MIREKKGYFAQSNNVRIWVRWVSWIWVWVFVRARERPDALATQLVDIVGSSTSWCDIASTEKV